MLPATMLLISPCSHVSYCADASEDEGEPDYSPTERPAASLRSPSTSRDSILAWISAASSRIDGVARTLGPLGGGANGLRTTSGGSVLAGAARELTWHRFARSWQRAGLNIWAALVLARRGVCQPASAISVGAEDTVFGCRRSRAAAGPGLAISVRGQGQSRPGAHL